MRERPFRPPLLRERDTIGVVSPASPGPALHPGRFERGVRNPEATGFRVRVAENARSTTGHTAGSVEQRVADLHAMFGSEEVRAIFCSIGGYNSNHLLDRLATASFARTPRSSWATATPPSSSSASTR